MGIFIRNKPHEERANLYPVTPSPMVVDFGTFITGQSLDEIEHLKNSDIYTATNIISGDIAKCLIRERPDGIVSKPQIVNILRSKPDTNLTSYGWLYAITMYTLLYGSAFAIIRRNGTQVTKLQIVSPHTITILQDTESKELSYEYIDPDNQKKETIKGKDMLHFRLNSIDGISGRSPLKALVPEIDMQTSGTRLLGSYFKKGIFGGAILKLTKGSVNNDVKRQIKKDFESINSGTQNANSVLVLDSTQEYETFTVNTDLLKLIQSNTFSTKQIAKVFGIPLNRFGMELVNSQDGTQNSIYIASTLSGYARMICDELNLKLNIDVELDFASLLNDTLDERKKRMFEGTAKGIEYLKPNEVRAYYGYPETDESQFSRMTGSRINVSRETNNQNKEATNDENGDA